MFKIKTIDSSYIHIQALEAIIKKEEWNIKIIRTDREPHYGILVECSFCVINCLKEMNLSWITNIIEYSMPRLKLAT